MWLKNMLNFCIGALYPHLRWMDLDMDHRRLYLGETKNGALRILPLSEAALCVLASLPRGNAHRFLVESAKTRETTYRSRPRPEISLLTNLVFGGVLVSRMQSGNGHKPCLSPRSAEKRFFV
jgi:hypothetical protein